PRAPAAVAPKRRFGAPRRQKGERKDEAGATRSFVPEGTRFMFAPQPSDESLGYSRASLRDVESRPPKHVRPRRGWDEGSVCMPSQQVSKLMRHHIAARSKTPSLVAADVTRLTLAH